MFEFLVTREDLSRQIQSDEKIIRIGSDPGYEISVPEEEDMEGLHLKIVVTDTQGCLLLPQSSQKEGLLNGQPLHSRPLEKGDVLEIGKTRISFLGPVRAEEETESSRGEKGDDETNLSLTPPAPAPPKTSASLQAQSPPSSADQEKRTSSPSPRPATESKAISQRETNLSPPSQSSPLAPSKKKSKPLNWISKEDLTSVPVIMAGFVFLFGFFAIFFLFFFTPGEKKLPQSRKDSAKEEPINPSSPDRVEKSGEWSKKEISAMIEKLGDENPQVRMKTMERLRKKWKKGGKLLLSLLRKGSREHPDPVVRWRCQWILEARSDPQATDPLRETGLVPEEN